MRSFITLIPAVIGLVSAQSATITDTTSYDVVPTPDALPLDDLRDVDVPSYTETPGLDQDIIFYATATAIATAAAEQVETPLSVFPAVTSVPINAAGEDDSTAAPATTSAPSKRGLEVRSACDPQATIANYYSVNVDNYSAFKADPTISSVALAAPTPSGYFNNFKNAPGANSAYAYLGYAIVNGGKTGYDVNWCAAKCNAISGCLSFNIYFERDPIVEPGTGCTNPTAFANIKCSFWGTGLDSKTATNTGQWRANFQVGIAGSNAYTSYKLGGPIDGYSAALSLNTSAMNAPLRDCAGTWTYMGYKLFQSGPFNPLLCSAACDAQTAYNLAHPPSTGKAAKCAAFGTYILSMTNKTGTYQQGQMCTMYTSNWDKQYAVNTVSYDDSIGAKYTYSYSFFYSKPDIQPICKADISSLVANGADFCTSFIGYNAPLTSTTTLTTPPVATTTVVSTATTVTTGSGTQTVTATIQWKRDDDSSASVLDNSATYTTVASVPAYSAVVLAEYSETVTLGNGTVPTNAPDNIVPAASIAARSAIATPANVVGWSNARISEACSAVATGTSTITVTNAAATPFTTVSAATTLIQTTLSACAVPSQLADYSTFTPVFGVWSNGEVGDNPDAAYNAEKTIQIPFAVGVAGATSQTVVVGTDGYLKSGGNIFYVFQGQGGGAYVYGGINGIYYRIAGPVGSRTFVVSWYVGCLWWGHQQNHYTATFFEDKPGYVQYKYYDMRMDPGPAAYAGTYVNGVSTTFVNRGQYIPNGQQISFYTAASANTGSPLVTQHDRVECCQKSDKTAWWGGWHSCTEYQAPKIDSLGQTIGAA